MEIKRIGIIREGKTPPDFRTPLTPLQCREVMRRFQIEVVVQSSAVRRYTDEEYRACEIPIVDDVHDCDVLLGVKEVPVDALIPNKTYLFFSHTIKKQPYNAKLLRAILDQKIRLIDYETLVDDNRKRIIGFGRYAGIVGAYEGFRAFGAKHQLYELKAPLDCHDREEMELQLKKVVLPKYTRVVLTGFGRVGNGAEEMMQLLPIRRISESEFLNEQFDEPVYTHLDTADYYAHKTRGTFDKQDFYSNPSQYTSTLGDTVKHADLYIACHLWASSNPALLHQEQMNHPDWKCKVIADISCDVNGPIPSTLRASTIASPIYGYLPSSGEEVDWNHPEAICVMAIDNLPCALPRDSSEDFGQMLINGVLPHFFNHDVDGVLWRASETTLQGELTPHFEYLKDYAQSAH